jgi:hypothetical protein
MDKKSEIEDLEARAEFANILAKQYSEIYGETHPNTKIAIANLAEAAGELNEALIRYRYAY